MELFNDLQIHASSEERMKMHWKGLGDGGRQRSGNWLSFCLLFLGSSLHPSLVRNDVIPHSHQPEMGCPLSFQL